MTRRPIAIRPNTPEEEARALEEIDVSPFAVFEHREEALNAYVHGAGRGGLGYQTRAQYVGRWDRWVLLARRKSWSSGHELAVARSGLLVKFWAEHGDETECEGWGPRELAILKRAVLKVSL